MSAAAEPAAPMTAPAPATTTRVPLGIALMLGAFFAFGLTNVGTKWLGQRFPTPEILFARSVVALACLAPFLRRAKLSVLWRSGRPVTHVLRILVSAVEVRCFFYAAAILPLADASALYLASPIYVTALSAIVLHERVGLERWLAVIVGFAGVLVAFFPQLGSARAGDGTILAMAICVLGSLLFAVVGITTRRLRDTPGQLLAAVQIAAVLVGMAALADGSWRWPGVVDLGWFAAIGSGSLVGYACYNQSLRVAPASTVAPYQYSSLVWAALLGFAAFGEVPTQATLLGGVIIIGAGGFILWRERRGSPSV